MLFGHDLSQRQIGFLSEAALCIDASLNTPAPPVPPTGSCAAYVDAGVTACCPGSVSDVLTARFYLVQVHPRPCLVDECLIAMESIP